MISNGESGLSVRTKINTAFDDIDAVESSVASLSSTVSGKQDTLVSGTNIKTINGASVLGSGDLEVTAEVGEIVIDDVTGLQTALDAKQATLVSGTTIKTINGTTVLGSGDITLSGGTIDSVNGQTGTVVLDAADVGALDEALAAELTAATDLAEDDQMVWTDTSAADLPVIGPFSMVRTRMSNKTVGTSLGTTGTIDLNLATLTGTEQRITLTGNPTFTTSNRAAGRGLELRLDAGGATRTPTWPAWVAFGAELPATIESGTILRVTLFCGGSADTDIDAASVVSV